nr:uncharacterized protein LOC109763699 isoform X3 [Aegilops tauschii subsp. strangulata]
MEHLVSLLLQGGPATALWRSRPLPSVGHRLLLLQAVPHPPIPAADRPFTAGTTVPSLPTTEAVQRRNDEYEKICRCTTEFADCHVKQCQQATSSKGKRRARLTSVVKNNRTSVLKFPAHQYTYVLLLGFSNMFWFSRLVLVQDTS